MLFGRSRNLVGLDVGDSSVKVVELKDLGRGRGFQVAKLGWEPLSSEAIVDGAIMDSQLVVETIQAFDKYVDGHQFWERTFTMLRDERALDPPSLAALLLA